MSVHVKINLVCDSIDKVLLAESSEVDNEVKYCGVSTKTWTLGSLGRASR